MVSQSLILDLNEIDEDMMGTCESANMLVELKPNTSVQVSVNLDISKFNQFNPVNNAISCTNANPQIPFEYVEDIYATLLQEELHNRVRFGYMKDQVDINEQMRAILVDWLIDVHAKFLLGQETLFLAINLIDRFLCKCRINRSKLQLVGVTALMIACKYDEIITPHIKDFVYITDNAYSKEEVFAMENSMLLTLKYEIVIPSSLSFFDIIALNYHYNKEQIELGRYLMEIFLIDYRMTKYLPSLIACSAAYIVMKFYHMTNYQEIYGYWNTNNNSAQLKECAKEICFLVDNIDKSNLRAIKAKYATDEHFRVSNISFGH